MNHATCTILERTYFVAIPNPNAFKLNIHIVVVYYLEYLSFKCIF